MGHRIHDLNEGEEGYCICTYQIEGLLGPLADEGQSDRRDP